MKKIVNKICSITAVALLLAACTAIDHDTATLENIVNARNTLTQATAHYLGQNAAGLDAYSLRLLGDGVSTDYALSSGKIVNYTYKGTGYIILIDSVFIAPSGSYDFPVGTFDISDTKEAVGAIYSIVLNNGSTAAAAEKLRATAGTITVAKAGDNYTITIDATNINGTRLNVSYTGKIEVGDAVYIYEPLTVSTQDFVIDDISFTSENYDLNSDYQMDISFATLILTGPKARIVIDDIVGDLYVIGEEPKRPAAGTYGTSLPFYNNFSSGEIYKVAGSYKDRLLGSYAWLLSNAATPSFSEMWYFVDAQMVVTEAGGVYTIAITATSANGSTITATYEDRE
jgi:hypothetical protein